MNQGLMTYGAQPARSRHASGIAGSYVVWLALMAYLVLVKLVITVMPAGFRSVEQAAFFGWPFIGIWTIAGLIGIRLAHRTGFPGALGEPISARRRVLIPLLLGLGFSIPFVAVDLLTQYTAWEAARHGQPGINIDLPASLLIYPGGAIIVEVFYRLLPIPLLLWLISHIMLKQRGETATFWALAILTSLIEPLTQSLGLAERGTGVLVTVVGLGFAFNLAQAGLFRRYGFLAAIIMRVAFYAVWHVLYVH